MTTYIDGIHHITNNEYHASTALSRSALMEFSRSPYHYWYKYLSGLADTKESSPAMNLGSAVHTLTLEPQKFDEEFFVISQKTRPAKDTAPDLKNKELANGRIILTVSEHAQAFTLAHSVLNNHEAKALLAGCKVEQSIYFTHQHTGIQFKCRPDALYGSLVIDLKTTTDASIKAFQNTAFRYGYFLQSAIIHQAFQSTGSKMEKFAFIVVEKSPPYSVAIYTLGDDALEYGLKQFNDLAFAFAQCKEKNTWPCYQIQELSLPGYAKFEDIMENEIEG